MNNTATNSTSTVAKRPNRRRQYLLNPLFQWRQAGMMMGVVFFVTILVSAVVCYMFHQQARMRLVNPGGGAGEAASVIVFASLAFAVITAVGVGVWSIYSSHRLCGPLYLITQYLNEVRDGRIPANLRSLRKKDEFKDFYGTVSAAIDAMRERKGHEVAALTRAIDAMSELHSADGADREALLNSVEKQLVALRDAAADELGEEQQVSNRSVVEDARVMMSV